MSKFSLLQTPKQENICDDYNSHLLWDQVEDRTINFWISPFVAQWFQNNFKYNNKAVMQSKDLFREFHLLSQ